MNEFGGEWTRAKLEALSKYLNAYRMIFDKNPRASYFRTIYIDGFAGSGKWISRKSELDSEIGLFEDPDETHDAISYSEGSVQIALGLDSPFDKYLLIEKDQSTAEELKKLIKEKYRGLIKRTQVFVGDCNEKLCEIAGKWNYSKDRAVCFLDPYGMSVNWSTIESIARTQAIDLWLLFPLGQGICRLLKKKEIPDGSWADKLDNVLGTPDRRDHFYNTEKKQDLFGELYQTERCVVSEEIGEYFLERMRTIFAGVSEKPLILKNSKNSPLFMLCFAAGNKKGSVTALKIANSIIGST